MNLPVEALAQEITRIDPRIRIGVSEILSEQLIPFIQRHIGAGQQGAGDSALLRERFLDAMESAHGYRPRVRDGELTNGRDADRYEGFRLATPQPPKPPGAVPLPEPSTFPREPTCGVCIGYTRDQLIAYGDAREAAGLADAVPAIAWKMQRTHSITGDWVEMGGWQDGPAPDWAQEDAAHVSDDGKQRYRIILAFGQPAPLPQQPAAEGAECVSVPRRELTDAEVDAFADHFGWCDDDKAHPEEREEVRRQWQAFLGIMAVAEGAGREAVAWQARRRNTISGEWYEWFDVDEHAEHEILSQKKTQVEWQFRTLYTHPSPVADAEALTPGERGVIESLLVLAYKAWCLADNTEDAGGENLNVERSDFTALSESLDKLNELPDDQPGYNMGEAAKARWALRRLISDKAGAAHA